MHGCVASLAASTGLCGSTCRVGIELATVGGGEPTRSMRKQVGCAIHDCQSRSVVKSVLRGELFQVCACVAVIIDFHAEAKVWRLCTHGQVILVHNKKRDALLMLSHVYTIVLSSPLSLRVYRKFPRALSVHVRQHCPQTLDVELRVLAHMLAECVYNDAVLDENLCSRREVCPHSPRSEVQLNPPINSFSARRPWSQSNGKAWASSARRPS